MADNQNHIEQYQEIYGKDAARMYAFTTSQIELIKGFQLLINGDLTDEEFDIVSGKLAAISSMQSSLFSDMLPLTQDQVVHAMESASAYIEKVVSGDPIQ